MRHTIRYCALGLLALAAFSRTPAEEIVHFTNGTYMAVQAHEIVGDLIQVNLGGNAKMSFPSSLVEKIDRGGRNVYARNTPSNVVSPGQGGAAGAVSERSYPATGEGSIPSRFRSASSSRREMMEPDAQLQAGQTAPDPRSPLAGHPNATARQMRVMGDRSAYNGGVTTPTLIAPGSKPPPGVAPVSGPSFTRIKSRIPSSHPSESTPPPSPPSEDTSDPSDDSGAPSSDEPAPEPEADAPADGSGDESGGED